MHWEALTGKGGKAVAIAPRRLTHPAATWSDDAGELRWRSDGVSPSWQRVAEERFRSTFDDAPIGMALVSLDGRWLRVNRAVCEIVGYSAEELLGLTFQEITHPDDLDADLELVRAVLAGERDGYQLHKRYLHADGRVVWIKLTVSIVRGADGAPLHFVSHIEDVTELKRLESRLRDLADHDTLTGLLNRRRLEEELSRAIDRAHDDGGPGALLLVDLDGFTQLNDCFGHRAGDELIVRVARLLRNGVQSDDVVARLGSDEFAVVLRGANGQQANQMAERMLAVLRNEGHVLCDGQRMNATASIGLSLFDRTAPRCADDLLIEADLALLAAKDGGKDRVCGYTREGRSGSALVTHGLLERLRAALEQERFVLLAQPIKAISAPEAPLYELLLRLPGDDGLISPKDFLPTAERFDLIQPLDRWVFAQAARLLALHHARGLELSLSVNMSAKTLCDARIVADIGAILDRTPVPPGRLTVEITETAALVNLDRAKAVAAALRERGCRVALDDFGAGFASFLYLKHVEFDYLKIDGEFIRSLPTNPTDRLVVTSLVDIARGLSAQTIAEFVSDDVTVEELRSLGVDYGQGFHLGRPAPLEELLPACAAAD